MNQRNPRHVVVSFLILSPVLATASPFDGAPTPRIPGFGGLFPALEGLTRLQVDLNAALAEGLLSFANGFDLRMLLATLAVAMAYGAVHALSPGHGKTLLVAHGLQGEGLNAASLLVPCLGAFLHVFSALLWTTMFTLLARGALGLGRAELSIALLVFSSTVLILNGIRELLQSLRSGHHSAHGRLAVVLGIGVIPCPVSTLIYSASIAEGLAIYGILICLIFSLGLALTMTVFSLIPVLARTFLERVLDSRLGRIALRALPMISSVFFVFLGVLGLFQAVSIG